MSKQVTKKQQVNNKVAISKVDNQVIKLEVSNQAVKSEVDNPAAKPEVDNQSAKVEVSNPVVKLEVNNQGTKPEVDQTDEPEVSSQKAELEASNQTVEAETTTSVSLFDFVWDEWLNGIKLGQAYQTEMENLAFQAIEQQKDVWVKSIENLKEFENGIHKFADQAMSYFTELHGVSFFQDAEQWKKQIEKITNEFQSCGISGSNLIGNSFDQIESTLKTTIQQQQKSRKEAQVLLESMIDQAKATNKVVMNQWGTSSIS